MSTTVDRIPGVPISLGKSINVPVGSLRQLSPPIRHAHARSTSESNGFSSNGFSSPHFKSKLPAAVANVSTDHIRGYIHSKKVNNYLVGSTLGEGSFAKVKEAFHVQVGEKVAMKVIDKKKASQDAYVAKNFRREAKLLQMVRHPNILHLMEVIETDTSFYLITELCSGGELMSHIYSKGRLDEAETRKYMRQIISSIDHLHRAGIIHRDLKVENMLLDSNMDIRIIDFGLSNEEYTEGENGRIHCNTQCGSPAYAAPELLGHKKYGPEVDIWSIGVNMFAMLTGCLPYTVEPFNITALHAKMLENKMNPIPDNLSTDCKGLLRHLLQSNPDVRIKMDDIMSHPWINHGHSLQFGTAPFPNKLLLNDINMDIVEHMVHVLKVTDTEDDLIQELVTNKATSAACTYYLLLARLKRFTQHFPSRKTRVRHKAVRVSQDHGYYEDGGDDNDAKSTKSVPTKRPTKHNHTRPSNVTLREKRGREGIRNQVTSHPPLGEVEEHDYDVHKVQNSRRKSMPHVNLERNLMAFEDWKKSEEKSRPETFKASTLPRSLAKNAAPKQTESRRRASADRDEQYDYATSPTEGLATLGKGMTRNYSQGHALNQMRKELRDKLHPPTVNNAWHSNPNSRTQSRNPSRHGSRIPSSTSTSTHGSYASDLDGVDDDGEDIFHAVNTQILPLSSELNNETHLPSLQQPQSRAGRRDHIQVRKNGYHLPSDAIEVKTDLSIDAILSEVLRVATNLKMRESEQIGNAVNCNWKGIRFKLSIYKHHHDGCRINFQWSSGGDLATFRDHCDRFITKLQL